MTLPTNAATANEPIPALNGDAWDGPDMALAMPIETMLAELRQFDDDEVGYVTRWNELVTSIGGFISATIDKNGSRYSMVGFPCDSQSRHRWRWHHFLTEDLNARCERREYLIQSLGRRLITRCTRGVCR